MRSFTDSTEPPGAGCTRSGFQSPSHSLGNRVAELLRRLSAVRSPSGDAGLTGAPLGGKAVCPWAGPMQVVVVGSGIPCAPQKWPVSEKWPWGIGRVSSLLPGMHNSHGMAMPCWDSWSQALSIRKRAFLHLEVRQFFKDSPRKRA